MIMFGFAPMQQEALFDDIVGGSFIAAQPLHGMCALVVWLCTGAGRLGMSVLLRSRISYILGTLVLLSM
jgi:hypothetical protein